MPLTDEQRRELLDGHRREGESERERIARVAGEMLEGPTETLRLVQDYVLELEGDIERSKESNGDPMDVASRQMRAVVIGRLKRIFEGQVSPSIVCPKCKRRSYNTNDIWHGYCGACHEFTSPPQGESEFNRRFGPPDPVAERWRTV